MLRRGMGFVFSALLGMASCQINLLPARYTADSLTTLSDWTLYIITSSFIFVSPVLVFLIVAVFSLLFCVIYKRKLKATTCELKCTSFSEKKYTRCYVCFLGSFMFTLFVYAACFRASDTSPSLASIGLSVCVLVMFFMVYGAIGEGVDVGLRIVENSALAAFYSINAELLETVRQSTMIVLLIVVVAICVGSVSMLIVSICSFFALHQRASLILDQCVRCPLIFFLFFTIVGTLFLSLLLFVNDMCGAESQVMSLGASKELLTDVNTTSNDFYRTAVVLLDYCITRNETLSSHPGCGTLYNAVEDKICVQTVILLLVSSTIAGSFSVFLYFYFWCVCCASRMLTKPLIRHKEAEEKRKEKKEAHEARIAEIKAAKAEAVGATTTTTTTTGSEKNEPGVGRTQSLAIPAGHKPLAANRRAKSLATLKKKITVDVGDVGPGSLKLRRAPLLQRRKAPTTGDGGNSDSETESSSSDDMVFRGDDDNGDVVVRTEDLDMPEWKIAELEAQNMTVPGLVGADYDTETKKTCLTCAEAATIGWNFFVCGNVALGVGAAALLVFDFLEPPLVWFYYWAPMFGVSAIFVTLGLLVWCVQITRKCKEYDIFNLEKLRMLGQVDRHDIEMLAIQKKAEDAAEEDMPDIEMDLTLFTLNMDDIRLDKQIGAGGSESIIYLALFKGLEVAVKMFRTVSFREQRDYDEFEREVKIMTACNHPNLLTIHGAAYKHPRLCMVMEFSPNGDIMDYLYKTTTGEKPPLTIREKMRIMQDIIEGMIYLHNKSIIHRDLKTLNVLLTADLTAKIIDFGLSKRADRGTGRHTKAIGTAVYMAPELTLGQEYGPKVDVFAFGIMMFEILTEKYEIYEGGSPHLAIEVSVARDANFRPEIGEKDYGRELRWFIRLMKDCWDHSPAARPTFKTIKGVFGSNWESIRSVGSRATKSLATRKRARRTVRDDFGEDDFQIRDRAGSGGSGGGGGRKHRRHRSEEEAEDSDSDDLRVNRRKKKKKRRSGSGGHDRHRDGGGGGGGRKKKKKKNGRNRDGDSGGGGGGRRIRSNIPVDVGSSSSSSSDDDVFVVQASDSDDDSV